jgi:hypothetical protein
VANIDPPNIEPASSRGNAQPRQEPWCDPSTPSAKILFIRIASFPDVGYFQMVDAFNYRSIADSALRNADQAAEPSLAQTKTEPTGLKAQIRADNWWTISDVFSPFFAFHDDLAFLSDLPAEPLFKSLQRDFRVVAEREANPLAIFVGRFVDRLNLVNEARSRISQQPIEIASHTPLRLSEVQAATTHWNRPHQKLSAVPPALPI